MFALLVEQQGYLMTSRAWRMNGDGMMNVPIGSVVLSFGKDRERY